MANAVLEVEAPRDITRQLLRHRSFSFQEFSQRYSNEIETTPREFRRQDKTNRQNSVDDLSEDIEADTITSTNSVLEQATAAYKEMIESGVARECARVVLPEGLTMSRLYVNGTLRSWLHYLEVRDDENVTQWEHVVLAREIKTALESAFPMIFSMKNWFEDSLI
jgi:thymidylate synthase (FAD)